MEPWYVYEIELDSGIPDYTRLVHVRATSEGAALERYRREKNYPNAIKSVTVRRQLADFEAVIEQAKAEEAGA